MSPAVVALGDWSLLRLSSYDCFSTVVSLTLTAEPDGLQLVQFLAFGDIICHVLATLRLPDR